jgi:hypothetical protein
VYEEGWQQHQVPTEENPSQVYYWIHNESGSVNASMPADAWSAHIHMECDSWLKPFGEEFVYHAGHVSEEEYFSEDYIPSDEAIEASRSAQQGFIKSLIESESSQVFRREPKE